MRTRTAAVILAPLAQLLCLEAFAAGPAPLAGQPADAEGRNLAAGSLRHSAVAMACSPSTTLGRAGRLVVLSRFADRLAPGDAATQRMLADIYLAQGRPADEAVALDAYLAKRPGDHARQIRRIAARLEAIQRAEKRIAFLETLLDSKGFPAPLRAEVAATLARLHQGQGAADEARAAAGRAMELDPYCPAALALRGLVDAQPTAASMATVRLRLLRGNPQGWEQAWQLGAQLGELGLHQQAVRFFAHAWSAERSRAGIDKPPLPLVVQYCNALLDANQPQKAIEVFEPLLRDFDRSIDLRTLLLEAYRAVGQDKKAARLTQVMAAAYKQRDTRGEASAAFSAELAWFYLVTLTPPRVNLAVVRAQQAAAADPDNVIYRRILGAAELTAGARRTGTARLEKLADRDPYAAVFLAEHAYARKDAQAGRKALLAGAKLSRSGPAPRRLAALAARQGVPLPPAEGSPEVAALVERFDARYLQMLMEPGRFLAVEIRPAGASVPCRAPVLVVAAIRNVGPVDVALGEAGLCRPVLAFNVIVRDEQGKGIANLSNLPAATWPAPRYLAPGKSVACTVRLDAADLAQVLARRPLEDLSLIVFGRLDPVGKAGTSLPGLEIKPTTIRRTSILGRFDRDKRDQWVQAYRHALGRIVGDLRRGGLPQRMRAARQVASLLAFAHQVEAGFARPPGPLAREFTKPVLLSLMRAFLKDPSPVVRQEMIAALGVTRPDAVMMSLLAPTIGDPSPLVRCRIVELLAAARSNESGTVASHLAKDKDPFVRAMAKVFYLR